MSTRQPIHLLQVKEVKAARASLGLRKFLIPIVTVALQGQRNLQIKARQAGKSALACRLLMRNEGMTTVVGSTQGKHGS